MTISFSNKPHFQIFKFADFHQNVLIFLVITFTFSREILRAYFKSSKFLCHSFDRSGVT